MLRRCDLEGVRDAVTAFLASIPYEANKDERVKDVEPHFWYTSYIINRVLGCYTTLIEKQNSKGRADIIIETDNDIFIFEFKLDKSAAEALEQIEEMQYALPYQDDKRKVHKIGVNISSTSITVYDWLVVDMDRYDKDSIWFVIQPQMKQHFIVKYNKSNCDSAINIDATWCKC